MCITRDEYTKGRRTWYHHVLNLLPLFCSTTCLFQNKNSIFFSFCSSVGPTIFSMLYLNGRVWLCRIDDTILLFIIPFKKVFVINSSKCLFLYIAIVYYHVYYCKLVYVIANWWRHRAARPETSSCICIGLSAILLYWQ